MLFLLKRDWRFVPTVEDGATALRTAPEFMRYAHNLLANADERIP